MPEKNEYVKFKYYEKIIKLGFIIYEDFESILVPGDNGEKIKWVLYGKISKTYCFQLWL